VEFEYFAKAFPPESDKSNGLAENGDQWCATTSAGRCILGHRRRGSRATRWRLGVTIALDGPARPFLAMNDYYLLSYDCHKNFMTRIQEIFEDIVQNKRVMSSPNMPDLIYEKAVKKKKFYKNLVIYDVHRRRFSVTDYELTSVYRDPWNLWGLIGERQYYYRFVTAAPTQLTFEQARDEIVEHIWSHRWVGQTGGTKDHFRTLQATKKNMEELIEGIAFYGKWPF
jgi:hypothetical protein